MMKIDKMLRVIVFGCAVVLSNYLHAQCPTLVWSDEFNGTSLDLSKWNYQTGDGCAEGICGWGNSELQSYQEANVSVSNGTLKIEAKKQRNRGSQYSSGRINSKGLADFTYGRFEARVKLPYGDGLWPAFWMLSTNEPYGGWPQSGEIDIMEFTASRPDLAYGTIHYGDLYPDNQYQGNEYYLLEGNFPDAFHEFAIEWEPNEIRWYIDGILYSTKTSADIAPYNWPFDQDFHFLINVAVGGNLGGPVNDQMLPATMEVDYVRVYDGSRPAITGDRLVDHQAANETYTIANIPNGTNVTWTVPADASIASGQGTDQVSVNFGSNSGYVTATFNSGCETQTLSIDVTVDPPYSRSFSFENFDEAANVSFNTTTGVFTEISNPSPSGVNSSALVGEYVRNSGELYDLLVYNTSAIGDAETYSNKDNKFYMDVLTAAPLGTQIFIQLETSEATPLNYPTGRHSRYVATITQRNTWHRVQFSLLDQPDPSASGTAVGTLIILFNSNSNTSDTYLFDNFDSYAAGGTTPVNQAPSVSFTNPSDGATLTTGSNVTLSANSSDADGSVVQVEFFANDNSIGVDSSAPFSVDWTVVDGSTNLSVLATDDEGATGSSQINVTGQTQSGGDPVSMHVFAIEAGSASAGRGQKYGTATITIVDDLGSPVANASVSASLSGTFNESLSGSTNSNGVVVLQSSGTSKGSLTINICVDAVSGSLAYISGDNVVTCINSSARIANDAYLSELVTDPSVRTFPNPVVDYLNVELKNLTADVQLEVIDIAGKKMFERKGNVTFIDMTSWPKGIYVLKITDGEFKARHKIFK
ncbi:MAG: family 16 glycosylhydrolase [Cyclobacteriaceae bacterium]